MPFVPVFPPTASPKHWLPSPRSLRNGTPTTFYPNACYWDKRTRNRKKRKERVITSRKHRPSPTNHPTPKFRPTQRCTASSLNCTCCWAWRTKQRKCTTNTKQQWKRGMVWNTWQPVIVTIYWVLFLPTMAVMNRLCRIATVLWRSGFIC